MEIGLPRLRVQKVIAAVALTLPLAGCNGDCAVHPCPLPTALAVELTASSSGATVNGASIAVSRAVSATVPCDARRCTIGGYAGTYTLVVAAPGYESAERTVDVQGSTPECGCASVQTQDLTFVLTPMP
jgi:hypothetical protein